MSSNFSANSISLSSNLCSNFTPNTHQNGSLGSNLNSNTSLLTNGLSNGLASNNNFGNSYYCDYQAYNSSSNSSSIALNSEYDYNQQNLVTNLSESNLNSNAIPPFYPTFSQGVKEPPANHQLNGHRIDSLIGSGSTTNLLSSNSSVGSSGSLYQLSAPSINLQPANHHAHSPFNHVQNNFLVTPNLQPAENFEQPYRSPEQSNSPYSYPLDTVEELKYDAFPRQLARPIRAEAAVDHVDFGDPKRENRRRMNNNRERVRVHKMNERFLQLNQTCNKVNNKEERLTKYEVLKVASHIITDLETQVSVSSTVRGATKPTFASSI